MNKKLEKLTPEQENLMISIRDKWINQLYDLKELNTPQLLDGVKWLYNFCNIKTPKVIICESILEAQLTLHFLKDNVGSNVWANVRDNVRDNVGANIMANVWANVRDNVGDNVRDNVGANIMANVRDNVRDNVWANISANVGANVGANIRANVWANVGANISANVGANVGANIRDNVRDNVWANISANVWANVEANIMANVEANVGANVEIQNMCSYGDINDNGWVSYYDFFTQIGIIDNSNFNSFMKLLQSNYYSMIQMDKICVVIKYPKHILLNETKQLNSTKDYAIKWKDNTGMHFVNGFYLSDTLFDKLSKKEYSFEDFINEKNEEVKSAVISFYQQEFGEEFLFRFLSKNLKEINTFTHIKDEIYLKGTTNGQNIGVYTLFKGNVNDLDIAYVRCYCPSTDRMFFLGVDPINDNAKDAIASLYKCPKILVNEIESINRQGEIFSTTFTEKGNQILDKLSKEDVNEQVSVTGDVYFQKLKYEF